MVRQPLHREGDDTKDFKLQPSDFWRTPVGCEPVRQSERLQRAAEREQQSKEAATNDRRRAAGIPLRLAKTIQASLQTPVAHGWRQKLDRLTESLGTGFLFGLIGTYGAGKSQMGATLAHLACEKSTALCVHAPDLFDTVKDVFRSDDGETVRKQIALFTTPKLLVIDEVNEGLSQADVRLLHRIVCQRYDDITDTLLISNEKKDAFQKLVGDRVISRMIETGGIIEANWPSFRT
jgi:DNA replication protein DnaC